MRDLAFVAVEAGQPAGFLETEVAAQRPFHHVADLVERHRSGVGQLVAAVPGEDAVPAVPERRDEGESVADRVDGERVRRGLRQPHVGEHDRFEYRLPGERQPESLTDNAVQPVGADGVVGPHCLAIDGQVHAVRILPQRGHLGAAHDADARRHRPLLEHLLHVLLRGDQEIGESARQRR
jgi:hypothetical protein